MKKKCPHLALLLAPKILRNALKGVVLYTQLKKLTNTAKEYLQGRLFTGNLKLIFRDQALKKETFGRNEKFNIFWCEFLQTNLVGLVVIGYEKGSSLDKLWKVCSDVLQNDVFLAELKR